MAKIILDDGQVELRLDLLAYEAIEKEFGSYDKMEALKKAPETKISTMLTLAAILANSAAIRAGREERYTRDYIASHIELFELTVMEQAINMCIAESLHMVKKKTTTGTTTSSSKNWRERMAARFRRGKSKAAD